MEGNEAPKADSEVISPKVPSAENKELEQRAQELAKATREKGMGLITGKFPDRLLTSSIDKMGLTSFTSVGFFIQGEEGDTLVYPKDTAFYKDGERNLQIWTRRNYVPPMESIRIDKVEEIKGKRFGILPKTTRVTKKAWEETNTPLAYNGKKGEKDWVQFEYKMPIYHGIDNRPGICVIMSVAVPPDIAIQIDEQVAKNVYFPDAFLKALYPGYIGPDKKQYITRIQAKDLQILNLTKGAYKNEVLKYPQPLPY